MISTNEIRVYKRKGITMGKLLKEIKKEKNLKDEKIAFTGRLDPLAHGEIILLIGKKSCKKLDNFIKKDKKYIFRMVSNLNTDSLDILGKANLSKNIKNIDFNKLEKIIKNMNGLSYKQLYPNYSSICVKNAEGLRQPLWWWTKNDRLDEINIPSKNVLIKNINILKKELIKPQYIIEEILKDICLLEDDNNGFRKKEIIESWNLIKENKNLPDYLQVYDLEADVSSGTYIRQLVQDISNKIGVELLTLSIFRPEFGNL